MEIIAFIGAASGAIGASLVLGGLAGLVTFFLVHRRGRILTTLVVALLVALLAFGGIALSQSYTQIPYGKVGLVVRFGGLTGQIFQPGLNWRTPFVDQILLVPTVVMSYETSDNPSESGADYRDYPITAQTVDGQQIQVKYTVLFRIPPDKAVEIAQNVGSPDAVVENVVKAYSRNLARLLAQSYTAEKLYSGEGIFDYENSVRTELEKQVARYNVVLADFLVRKVEFSDEYVSAIEQKQIAQEAIETAKYNAQAAEYEKQRQIRLAEAEAEKIKLNAQADAERQRLLADSEAYSIQKRGEALKAYPNLVQWQFVTQLTDVKWGILPANGVTPLIPLSELTTQP